MVGRSPRDRLCLLIDDFDLECAGDFEPYAKVADAHPIAASPASRNVQVQAIRRPLHARVRARGTDIGFSNKPPYCFLFIFLSFFCFFSFFPSFSLLAMFGSFLCCFNSPAAPAAGEIWVQKKRVVSDAPEAWIWGCCFMDFSLVCYLKTLPALAGQGETKIAKTAAGFGIILGIKGMELLWQTKQKIRLSCISLMV